MFIRNRRMDNLLSSFAAVEALAESYTSDSFASTSSTSAQAILLFDKYVLARLTILFPILSLPLQGCLNSNHC
jgi:hypothetical protein